MAHVWTAGLAPVHADVLEKLGMWQKLLTNKNLVIGVTFMLSLCLFTLITLVDYIYRYSDYKFYSNSIVSLIDRSFKSEVDNLKTRKLNYMNAIFREENVARLVKEKDTRALKAIYDPVYVNFRHRLVPVILLTVVDAQGHVLYRKSDLDVSADIGSRISNTLKHVLERKKQVSGFESDFFPFWFDSGFPIFDRETGKIVGALEVGLDPEWFQFKFGWVFEGLKSAIAIKDTTLKGCTPDYNTLACYHFIEKTVSPLKDVEFFTGLMSNIDMNADFSEIKVGDKHYLVSTSLRLSNHDGQETGRFLVAYNMSTFKKKQWEYLKTRLILFLPAIIGLLTVIYFGFRKYEKIINEKNRLLAQKSKNAALGEMLGYIGHQWRQPLHTLSLAVQNIELQNQLGQLDDAMVKQQVDLANQNISYMSHIIDDWRALLMSGSSRQEIDLRTSVERAISMLAPAMEQNRITIGNRISEPVLTRGFVNDLVQLSVNVLLNAKDQLCLIEKERVILITCHEEQGGLVTVRFQDSAGGIPKNLLTRIFEPYVTTKDKTDGTGLGLYLCRQIAENLDNGKVWAENSPFEWNGENYFGACICLQFSRLSAKE